MSDSDREVGPQGPPPKRERRHRFKTFVERVAEVDVDVFRRVQKVRSLPKTGTHSFFQEHLEKWRELNSAADFLAVSAAVHPLCGSLPQLLHHKASIVDTILHHLHLKALLSAAPLLDLLAALTRDLGSEMLPLLPAIFNRLSDLVDEGGDREPEMLEALFTAVSLMFKHLSKLLSADLPSSLKLTAGLRYSRAEHVRTFASQAVGFLFRNAPQGHLQTGIRALLAEHAVRPVWARTHGAGTLLAESMQGVGNTTHSRLPVILSLLLQEDLLKPSDFQTKSSVGQQTGVTMTTDHLRGCAAAVASIAIDQLLEHVRRGKTVDLWATVTQEVQQRLHALGAAVKSKKQNSDMLGLSRSAARAVGLLAEMVHFHRGSRVEEFDTVLSLLNHLGRKEVLSIAGSELSGGNDPAAAPAVGEQGLVQIDAAAEMEVDGVLVDGASGAGAADHTGGNEAEDEVEEVLDKYLRPSLPEQSLHLLLGVINAHCKVIGASQGMTIIQRSLPLWTAYFSLSPSRFLLPFLRSLTQRPVSQEGMHVMGPYMLGALGGLLVNCNEADSAGIKELALPLLVDTCGLMAPQGVSVMGKGRTPLLLLANPGGVKLAEYILKLASSFTEAANLPHDVLVLAEGWCAVMCLPYASKDEEAVVGISERVMSVVLEACKTEQPGTVLDSYLLLYSAAIEVMCKLLPSHSPARLEAAAESVLAVALQHPESYALLKATAHLLTVLRRHAKGDSAKRGILATPKLLEALKVLEPNLSLASQSMRAATLSLLCAFDQPELRPSADDQGPKSSSQPICDVFPVLLSITSEPCTIEHGRTWAVAISRFATQLEYDRIPEDFTVPLVKGVFGVLYMRFSPLWEPCAEALGAALQYRTADTWPVLLAALEKVQGSFLAGTGQGISAPPPTWSLERGLSESEEVPDGLKDRFHTALLAGTPEALRGCTDASTRLTYLLKAMSKVPSSTMEAKGKDWVPFLLTYTKAKSIGGLIDVEEEDSKEEQDDAAGADGFARVGMKAWRMCLREWLTLLAGIRGARGLPHTLKVQQSVAGLLLDTDQGLQQAVLKCLKAFKYKYLTQHIERLLRVSDNATLREELVSFPLAKGADGGVTEEHRAGLLPILIRVLFPKMRKRSGRLAGKGASGSARAAILNSLAALEPLELQPLLELFLAPLAPVFKVAAEQADSKALQATENDMDTHQLLPPAWWAQKLSQHDGEWWLTCVDTAALNIQPLRRKLGFLNAFEDLLNHLGYRLKPYLPALLAILLHLLAAVCSEAALQPASAANTKGHQTDAGGVAVGPAAVAKRSRQEAEATQKHKEIRSQCLRLLAQVLERFPATIDYNFMWDSFFGSIHPLLGRLAAESASEREPPLLACTFSLASSPALVSVLADKHSAIPEDSHQMLLDSSHVPAWAKEKRGSALLLAAVGMLQAPNCSEASRSSVLALLQGVLDMEEEVVRSVLVPWSGHLMGSLRAVVVAVWEGKDRAAQGKKGKKSANVLRELAILERLGSFTQDAKEGLELADALVSLLQHKPNKRGKAFADETGGVRALGALTAVWDRLAVWKGEKAESLVDQNDRLLRHWDTLSSLPIRLTTRDARAAMCSAVMALARLLPALQHTAGLLSALNSWLPDRVEEMDYDRRLKAYSDLIPLFWSNLTVRQCSPLLLTCLYDLRNADDLALRQAAAQAVIRFVEGIKRLQAASTPATSVDDKDASGHDLPRIIPRVLFPHLKSQLSSSQLAVRQEHLMVLRTMVVELPEQFPELLHLSSKDQETDFFLNVAHLQAHRRVRALGKLRKLIVSKGKSSDELQEDADATMEDQQEGDELNNAVQPHPDHIAHMTMLLRLLDVVLPLMKQAILDAGGDKSARAQEKRDGDASRESNVVDAAINTLGPLMQQLPWPQYRQILFEFLNLLKATPTKPVLRALCVVIDHFHFDLTESDGAEAVGAPQQPPVTLPPPKVEPTAARQSTQHGEEDDQQAGEEELMVDEEEDNVSNGDTATALATTLPAAALVSEEQQRRPFIRQVPAKKIRNAVMKRVLPTLHGQLVQNDVVRAPVALALVKLMKLLPDSVRRVELPRTLQAVSNLLKSRAQSVRDDARSVIVGMSVELGADYVPYVCQVLRASLPDRGYTAHVMGYTLHAVLEAVVRSDQDGTLDGSVELALPIVEAELFGETGLAKEAEMFAVQYKESKRSRANETYQLLAQGITLDTHLTLLLSLVRAHLPAASSPKVRNKLTLLLQHAARGVLLNPTATADPLMAFVHDSLRECLAEEEKAQALAKAAQGAAISAAAERTAAGIKSGTVGSTAGDADTAAAEHLHGGEDNDMNGEGDGGEDKEYSRFTAGTPYDYLLVEFSLQLLQQAMKKGQLKSQDRETLGYLDPVLGLLVRALKSRHSGSVSLALRCLSFMVHMPLPSLQVQAGNIGKTVTTLLKKVPSIQHPIAQECFKLLAGMLRDCSVFHPSTAQLRFLLSWTFTDLEDAWDRGTAFSLLRAILNRKVVLPEVYDVMNRVQEVMVKAHSAPIRQLCSSALLQFLLDFPLGPKRLQKHMQFLLSNLEFEYEEGRLQVLDLLQQIVLKFPEHVIESYAELLFLPLVVRLVSDPAPKARAAVASTLRTLLGRVSQERRQTLGTCCVAWLAEDATQMKRAAAQTLGLLAEVEGAKFSKRVPDLVQPVVDILSWQSNANCGGVAETDGEAELLRCPRWQEAYYCLLMLEKVATKAASSLSGAQDTSLPTMWHLVGILLSHNHMWVRKASARLVGMALAQPSTKTLLLHDPNAAGLLAWRLYQQMDSEAADETTCKQAVKCLVGLSDQLMKAPGESKGRKRQGNGGRGDSRGGREGEKASSHGLDEAQTGEEEGVDIRRDELQVGGGDEDVDNSGAQLQGAGGEEDVDNGNAHPQAGGEVDIDINHDGGDENAAPVPPATPPLEIITPIVLAPRGSRRSKPSGHLDHTGEEYTVRSGEEDDEKDEDVVPDPDNDENEGGDGDEVRVREDELNELDELDELGGKPPVAADSAEPSLSMWGLARRMGTLAEDSRWNRKVQRKAALGWIAATGTALGATGLKPLLVLLMKPLYRTIEGDSRVPEDMKQLGQEVVAHLRDIIGADEVLAGYNAARKQVQESRAERKKRAGVQALVDPEAVAQARRKKTEQKQVRQKRLVEDQKRVKSAHNFRAPGVKTKGMKKQR